MSFEADYSHGRGLCSWEEQCAAIRRSRVAKESMAQSASNLRTELEVHEDTNKNHNNDSSSKWSQSAKDVFRAEMDAGMKTSSKANKAETKQRANVFRSVFQRTSKQVTFDESPPATLEFDLDPAKEHQEVVKNVVEDTTESTVEEDYEDDEPAVIKEVPPHKASCDMVVDAETDKEERTLLSWEAQESFMSRRRASQRKPQVELPGMQMSLKERMSLFQRS